MSLPTCIAFEGARRLAAGSLLDVALAVRRRAASAAHEGFQVFETATGRSLTLDLSGSEEEVGARYQSLEAASLPEAEAGGASPSRGPGRPRLGVVAREVTLLPRHWDWLNAQPGGASVALRKLVEEARKTRGASDQKRARQEAAYRFIHAIAGDWPNYEESLRALFAGEAGRLADLIAGWPADVRDHAQALAREAFAHSA